MMDDLDLKIELLDMQLNNAALLERLQRIVAQDEKRGTKTNLKFPLYTDGNKPHYLSIRGLIEGLKITIAEDAKK